METKAIIFDMDGVIFDSEVLHKKAWEKVFDTRSIVIDEKEFLRGIGISDKDFLMMLASEGKIPLDIELLISEKRKILLEIAGSARVFDGMVELIKHLSKRYKLAVASNSDREFVMKLMKKAEVKDFFDVILCFQDISKPKPDPEIYLKCAERLGFSPSECVVMEDSPAGIKAAKAAGMRCIAISGQLGKELLSFADLVIEKPDLSIVERFLEK